MALSKGYSAMLATTVLALLAALPMTLAQTLTNETVLGVYMFHRHGDRTPKILPPANLTDLGYREVFTSGEYYRSRYIGPDAPYRISGINTDLVMQSQIQASAPLDDVLQNSAMGFLQALYPPVGAPLDAEELANGTSVTAPMDGYQLIPVAIVESGSGSEDSSWLQDTSSCYKAEISSNNYFISAQYNNLYKSTQGFYKRLLPILEPVFNSTTATYENAYTIYDYIHVAEIHNSTIPHSNLLGDSTLHQLFTLANTHEWNLAHNSSEPIRAIAGKQLGAQVVQFLNTTIEDAGSDTGSKFAVQFGAYASFSAFFGLAQLPAVNVDFTGVTDYASSMVFEMFTNTSTDVTTANFPSADDIYVRFLYRNGTATDATPPLQYPLFGTGQMDLKWNDFVNHMNEFSIGDTATWCHACGNTTGICEAFAPGSSSAGSTSSESCQGAGNGLSPAVNGVIGAMVTLAVILGLEALIMLIFGLTVVSKKKLQGASGAVGGNGATKT